MARHRKVTSKGAHLKKAHRKGHRKGRHSKTMVKA